MLHNAFRQQQRTRSYRWPDRGASQSINKECQYTQQTHMESACTRVATTNATIMFPLLGHTYKVTTCVTIIFLLLGHRLATKQWRSAAAHVPCSAAQGSFPGWVVGKDSSLPWINHSLIQNGMEQYTASLPGAAGWNMMHAELSGPAENASSLWEH